MFPLRRKAGVRARSAGALAGTVGIACAAATSVVLSLHAATAVISAARNGQGGNSVVALNAAQSPRVDGKATAIARPLSRSEVLSSDDWLNGIRSEKYWASRRSSGSGSSQSSAGDGMMGLWGEGAALGSYDGRGRYSSDGSYRTVCVRLCDGYFFPISASASSDDLDEHEAQCTQRCSSPAKLYIYRNGQEPDDMVDLHGQPYSRLSTAFLYRTTYDASCKCKPHPWEEAAVDQHRLYTLQAEAKKGNRKVLAELDALKAKVSSTTMEGERTHDRRPGKRHKDAARGGKHHAATERPGAVPGAVDGAEANLIEVGPPAGRRGAASVKVIRPGDGTGAGESGESRVKVTSRDEDWRRRALGAR